MTKKRLLLLQVMLLSMLVLTNAQLTSANIGFLENTPRFSNFIDHSLNSNYNSLFYNEPIFDFIQSGRYGSLAIDGNQGRSYGFAYNYSSQSDADERATSECGRGCYVVLTFGNGMCGAYAADQSSGSTVYGWGKASDAGTAQNYARNACEQRGGRSCIIRVWGCNSR